jgi:hypothetical protein
MAAAAQVSRDIAGQRLQAGQSLAGLGQGGLGQAIGAAQQGVTASQLPLDFYNKYAGVIFGTPGQSYSPNFSGTQGFNRQSQNYEMGVNLGSALPKIG